MGEVGGWWGGGSDEEMKEHDSEVEDIALVNAARAAPKTLKIRQGEHKGGGGVTISLAIPPIMRLQGERHQHTLPDRLPFQAPVGRHSWVITAWIGSRPTATIW